MANASGTSIEAPPICTALALALVNVTGWVRRPASTTVGPNAAEEADAPAAPPMADPAPGLKVLDDDVAGRRGVAGNETLGSPMPTVGNRATTTVGSSVVAGIVGELVTSGPVDAGTVGEAAGGWVTGGMRGGVDVVVVVVVSTVPPSDELRSAAQTTGAPTGRAGSSSVALANTSHRPNCEIAAGPVG